MAAADLAPYDKDFDHGDPVFFYAGAESLAGSRSQGSIVRVMQPANLRAGFVVASSSSSAAAAAVPPGGDDSRHARRDDVDACSVAPVTSWKPDSGSGIGAGDHELLRKSTAAGKGKGKGKGKRAHNKAAGGATGIGSLLGPIIHGVPDDFVFPRFVSGDAVVWFDVDKGCVVEATFVAFQAASGTGGSSSSSSSKRGLNIHTCIIAIAPTARNLHYASDGNSLQRTVRTDHIDHSHVDFDAGERVEILAPVSPADPVSYTHLTLPTIYSV